MARIILLSQQVIDRMIADPAFQEFQCIANPPRTKHTTRTAASKGCCGGRKRKKAVRKQVAGAVDYNSVKRAIIDLPKHQQTALKSLLGCTGLKIQCRDHRKTVHRCVI